VRKKRTAQLLVIVIVILIGVLWVTFNITIAPVIRDLSSASVSNKASAVINDAIEAQLQAGEIAYDKIINLERNTSGEITAIRTDISEINRLKVKILNVVDQRLSDLCVEEIGVPLGSLVMPKMFSGTGPLLPVRVLSVSTSDAEFRNVFLDAGINQTSHQIMLDISVVVSVLTPGGTQIVSVVSSVLVAETVIVGKVPSNFVEWSR